jgi:predicted Zn-dependent protease
VAFVGLSWGVYAGGRALAGYLALQTPYTWDQGLGALAKERYLAGSTRCTNPVLVGAVQEIMDQLIVGLEPTYREIDVYVLEDDKINAFALPGGQVFVLTGLLQEIQSPEELVGVLGHELGHVVKRHGMQRIAESLWFNFIIAQIFGDVSGIGEAVSVEAIELVETGFGRDQERESDAFGLALMGRVGYEPRDFPNFFGRLPDHGMPEFLSTHPDPGSRAEKLHAEIALLDPIPTPVPPPALELLKAPCHDR